MSHLHSPRSEAVAAVLAGTTILALGPSALWASPQDGYADLVTRLAPRIVTVEAAGVADPFQDAPTLAQRLSDDVLRDIDRLLDRPDAGPGLQTVGSGLAVDPEGLIVTNARAVTGAERVEVTLADGRRLPAEVAGTDPLTDLALLRVEGVELPAVAWADPAALRVGDRVLAIGDPAGPGNSVTEGLVSAWGRPADPARDGLLIETDARIDRLNTGGPLVNAEGEVVGLSDAWLALGRGGDGLSLALPADVVQGVVADLRDDGRVERGWLGVNVGPMTADMARSLNLDTPHGAVVAGVQRAGPASAAGLRQGDVILAFQGTPIRDSRDLTRQVASSRPGTEVELTVLRDRAEQPVDVTLGDLAARGT